MKQERDYNKPDIALVFETLGRLLAEQEGVDIKVTVEKRKDKEDAG